jgi:hypothetical protein
VVDKDIVHPLQYQLNNFSPIFCESIVNVRSFNESEHVHGLNDGDILNGEKLSDENILKLSEKLLTWTKI